MNPLALIIPLALVAGGIVGFFLLPLPPTMRLIILGSDILAAVIIGLVLARRGR